MEGLTRERLFVVGCVLVTELCERLTFYSVMANLVLFCTSILDFSSDDASVVTFVFAGTVYILAMLGGFIADAWAGKFNTIIGSCLLYIQGLLLLSASGINYQDWFGEDKDLSLSTRKGLFFAALAFIATGTGGIKTTVGPFGAQQVEDLGPKAVQSFFIWFNWFINVGTIIAYSGVAYVQQEKGFDNGFLIPLVSMTLALVVFVAAKSKYKHTVPEGSILGPLLGVCLQSFSGCRRTTFNRARQDNGGRFENDMVDAGRGVVRVLPVFLSVIGYWAVYSQMSTSLFLQSERMDISIGETRLPAAALSIFNSLMILILLPVMDRVVYPLLAKIGRLPTKLQRIGIGMILAAFAMLYAGLLEIIRKNDIANCGYIEQTLSYDNFNASRISMFAQVPEFLFLGSSEVLAYTSGLEFAYTQAPPFLQGFIMGLFLTTHGLGYYLASLIVVSVELWRKSDASDWFPKEPNNGHMEYILFLLASLTILNLVVFTVIARWYEHKEVDVHHELQVDPEVVIHVVLYDNNGYEKEWPQADMDST